MKSEIPFAEWKTIFLQKIKEAGLATDFDEEILELMHMEAIEANKSAEEMAEDEIRQSKKISSRKGSGE